MDLPSGIAQSLEILRFQRSLWDRGGVDMEDVFRRMLAVLHRVGADWALVGAHAINAFVRPRATVDIDFVVDARKLPRLLKEMKQEFGAIETADMGAALRVTNLSIDLIRSDNHALFHAALEQAEEREGVRIPPPELLLVLKFLAAVNPWRQVADRKQDLVDFIRLYQAVPELDRERAVGLAASAYPGAEREFNRLLDQVERGEDVHL